MYRFAACDALLATGHLSPCPAAICVCRSIPVWLARFCGPLSVARRLVRCFAWPFIVRGLIWSMSCGVVRRLPLNLSLARLCFSIARVRRSCVRLMSHGDEGYRLCLRDRVSWLARDPQAFVEPSASTFVSSLSHCLVFDPARVRVCAEMKGAMSDTHQLYAQQLQSHLYPTKYACSASRILDLIAFFELLDCPRWFGCDVVL